MKISWIYARNTDCLIGNENKLPWKSKTDMEHFRSVTYGNAVVMGRKTFESLGSKPLQGRLNVVVTRDVNYKAPNNVLVLHDIEDINRKIKNGYNLNLYALFIVYRLKQIIL